MVASKQFWGDLETICLRCGKKITLKLIEHDGGMDGSYTKLCGCGCDLYQYHEPDISHKTAFFTRKFIPAKYYRTDFRGKDEAEKLGFTKKENSKGEISYCK